MRLSSSLGSSVRLPPRFTPCMLACTCAAAAAVPMLMLPLPSPLSVACFYVFCRFAACSSCRRCCCFHLRLFICVCIASLRLFPSSSSSGLLQRLPLLPPLLHRHLQLHLPRPHPPPQLMLELPVQLSVQSEEQQLPLPLLPAMLVQRRLTARPLLLPQRRLLVRGLRPLSQLPSALALLLARLLHLHLQLRSRRRRPPAAPASPPRRLLLPLPLHQLLPRPTLTS